MSQTKTQAQSPRRSLRLNNTPSNPSPTSSRATLTSPKPTRTKCHSLSHDNEKTTQTNENVKQSNDHNELSVRVTRSKSHSITVICSEEKDMTTDKLPPIAEEDKNDCKTEQHEVVKSGDINNDSIENTNEELKICIKDIYNSIPETVKCNKENISPKSDIKSVATETHENHSLNEDNLVEEKPIVRRSPRKNKEIIEESTEMEDCEKGESSQVNTVKKSLQFDEKELKTHQSHNNCHENKKEKDSELDMVMEEACDANEDCKKVDKNTEEVDTSNIIETHKSDKECTQNVIDNKIDDLLLNTAFSSNDEQEDEDSSHPFIDCMAEEGEEDTPSEGNNDITVSGEPINTTESEFSNDESYENNSFIDDQEYDTLLPGDEFDVSLEKENPIKKSRIIHLDGSSSDDNIIIEKPKKKKPLGRKKKSRIIKVDDSSDEDTNNTPELLECDVSEEKNNLDDSQTKAETPDLKLQTINESQKLIEEKPVINTNIRNSKNKIIIHEDITLQGNQKVGTNTLSPKQGCSKKIIIQENIKIEDIQQRRLGERINQVLNSLYLEMKSSNAISVNVSLESIEYTDSDEDYCTKTSGNDAQISTVAIDNEDMKTRESPSKNLVDNSVDNNKNNYESETLQVTETKKTQKENKTKSQINITDKAKHIEQESKKSKKRRRKSNQIEEKIVEQNTPSKKMKYAIQEQKVQKHSDEDGLYNINNKQTLVEKVEKSIKKKKKKKKHLKNKLDTDINKLNALNIVDNALLESKKKKISLSRKHESATLLPLSQGWKVKNQTIQPSQQNDVVWKTRKYKSSAIESPKKFHPKDFKNWAIYDYKRNKRMSTQQLLRQRINI